jgi:hypothetical protein
MTIPRSDGTTIPVHLVAFKERNRPAALTRLNPHPRLDRSG